MNIVKLWSNLLVNFTMGTNIYSLPWPYIKMQGTTDDAEMFSMVNATDCEDSVFPDDNEFSNSEGDCVKTESEQQVLIDSMEDDESENTETGEMDKDDVENENEACEGSGVARKKQAKILRNRYSREEYRCTMCPYTCTTEKAFLRHLQRCESTEKRSEIELQLSCPVCGKDRRGEHSLLFHMKKHKDNKHFCCDICKFRTLQLKKLIQHRRMHTGERPHLCPFCSYRSARRDNLRSHARRVHKQDNLPCDTFTPRSMLVTPRKIK